MSKMKIVVLAIVLPLFLVGMFAMGMLLKNNSKAVAGPNILTPTPFNTQIAEAKETGPAAILTKELGTVTYKLPGGQDFQTLTEDDVKIPTGTTVKTGDASLAHVVFPDNSLMSLSKDTEITVNFEEKKIKILQVLGNTWHRVESVIQGNSYEVETPNTLATVRGTEFNVGIMPNNESEVYVMESVVDVSKIAKKADGQMVVEETLKVEKDKHIYIPPTDKKAPMKLVDLPANKKNTAWFKRNTEITTEIRKQEAEALKEAGMENKPEVTPGKNQSTPKVSKTPDPQNEKKMDEMKHQIRDSLMKDIKKNPELKKIDALFPIVKPSGSLLNNIEPKSSVLGTTDRLNVAPTATPVSGGTSTTLKTLPTPTPVPIQLNTNTKILPTSTPAPKPTSTTAPLQINTNLDTNKLNIQIIPTATPVPIINPNLNLNLNTIR